jgi:hypothetical protein
MTKGAGDGPSGAPRPSVSLVNALIAASGGASLRSSRANASSAVGAPSISIVTPAASLRIEPPSPARVASR